MDALDSSFSSMPSTSRNNTKCNGFADELEANSNKVRVKGSYTRAAVTVVLALTRSLALIVVDCDEGDRGKHRNFISFPIKTKSLVDQ